MIFCQFQCSVIDFHHLLAFIWSKIEIFFLVCHHIQLLLTLTSCVCLRKLSKKKDDESFLLQVFYRINNCSIIFSSFSFLQSLPLRYNPSVVQEKLHLPWNCTAIQFLFDMHTDSWVGRFRLQPDFRIQISQKAIKYGFEMHFECDFSPFRIQTLTLSRPCRCRKHIGTVLPCWNVIQLSNWSG